MGNMKDIADSVRGSLIPQLYVLRHVPLRYRRMLPLPIMKRFQCMVVGSAQGVLTVAITDRQNTSIIESLRKITGRAIFPVLIDPDRMHLLIQRIERYEQNRQAFYSTTRQAREQAYYLSIRRQLMMSSIMMLLTSQRIGRTW
jgi:type II secretion system (T2SS) protein E